MSGGVADALFYLRIAVSDLYMQFISYRDTVMLINRILVRIDISESWCYVLCDHRSV